MNISTEAPLQAPEKKNPILRMLIQLTISALVLSAFLFLFAGRVNWPLAWIYIVVWLSTKYIFILVLAKRNPSLLLERSHEHKNRQRWDKPIQTLNVFFSLIAFIVAALDAGKYNWGKEVPEGLIIASYVVFVGLNLLALWASLSNPFHSDESRIQADREQYVVSNGPYRYIRHPSYLAGVFMWIISPFMLGSWWALIPGVFAALMVVLRAALEDRMLHNELPGYSEYAQNVCYRLVPGIW
ncbi:MAG: isoprenylcysteine carboxylmethyltransferase family protein [Anaerolineales bacterium]|jgi:protein-S-isoprenylcysteine O-methyltransferase Ste14